jgi:uncharacterized protein (DUF427 family)
MSVHLRRLWMEQLGALRHEPTQKRIRAKLGDRTVVDSTRALLVWEPKRIVPTYAVPVDDIAGDLVTAVPAALDPSATSGTHLGRRTVYDPSVPFSVHTADGEPMSIRVAGTDRMVEAFRPDDPELRDYVVVAFDGFDEWYEEDERNLAHPRDPFHRIDILHSTRHVQIELDGTVLADSTTPYLLFEPPLPVRYYLHAGDVRTDLLSASDHVTFCAYKGQASYWSVGDEEHLAWCYRQPLRDASEVAHRVAFFNERVDVIVDGERQDRPVTPWSPRR